MDFARAARYGSEACEHVAFNEAIVQAGGLLHIFPDLLNHSPPEHAHLPLSGLRRIAADLDPRSYPIVRRFRQLLRLEKEAMILARLNLDRQRDNFETDSLAH